VQKTKDVLISANLAELVISTAVKQVLTMRDIRAPRKGLLPAPSD
jgi:hypothetical protein